MSVRRDAPIDELFALFDAPAAHRLYDEVVTEREHALQCAALAAADGRPSELVAAALLHDVGHLVVDDGGRGGTRGEPSVDLRHESVGARYLGRWFPPAVTGPVALHVAAKRYLCAVDENYTATLSAASVHSLELQGGPMTLAEADAFERNPSARAAVDVRRWDDQAKVADLQVPDLAEYEPLLRALASR